MRGTGTRVAAAVAAALLAAGCTTDRVKTVAADSTTTTAAVEDLQLEPGDPTPTEPAPSTSAAVRRRRATASPSTTEAPRSGGTSATSGSGASGGAAGGSGEAALAPGGLGVASFGTASDTAVAALTRSFGRPTRDVRDPGAACPGPERMAVWGRLTVTFAGGKLAGWQYDDDPGTEPKLATASGVTTGTDVATLRRVYGQRVAVHPPEEPYAAAFEVDGGRTLAGFLTSEAPAGRVTTLHAGLACGE